MVRRAVINSRGEAWQVECRQSERLVTIDGYLVAYKDEGIVVTSTQVSQERQHNALSGLLHFLTHTPVNTPLIRQWKWAESDAV